MNTKEKMMIIFIKSRRSKDDHFHKAENGVKIMIIFIEENGVKIMTISRKME